MPRLFLALLIGLLLAGIPAMATPEPPFTVRLAQGDFSVRDYPALVVAEVTVIGDRSDAASQGFRLLAGYIFGGNTRRASIAMTAPVIQQPAGSTKIAMTAPVLQSGAGKTWTVRFVMPEGSTLEKLPKPNSSRVRLHALPPTRMAVVKFSGLVWPSTISARTAALQDFMKVHHLQVIGAPSLAQYNPPWTLWFMRRNEVMIPIAP
ncbi:MAG: SOUL family heme-binding protein [Novosphingobium sp.]